MQVAWETLLVAQERSFGGQRNSAARFRASLPPSLYLGQPSVHLFSNPLILSQQFTQGLLLSKLGQKVCERVGFRFDSDWKGLRHQLVREARQYSGRQWRRQSSAEFGTLSARDLVQTKNKQSEVSVSDARRVRDCESGAW